MQCSLPLATPLNPLPITFRSWTTTAPTWRREHVAIVDQRVASSKKN